MTMTKTKTPEQEWTGYLRKHPELHGDVRRVLAEAKAAGSDDAAWFKPFVTYVASCMREPEHVRACAMALALLKPMREVHDPKGVKLHVRLLRSSEWQNFCTKHGRLILGRDVTLYGERTTP
jgi:hypothetical protein